MNPRCLYDVMLISLGSVRPDSLGCYGDKEAKTPALDAIAREGVRFTAAFSEAPFTPALHASVLTGLNPNRHGIRWMPGQRLRPVPTLAEIFHSAGWSTAAFGRSGGISEACGLDLGFSLFDDSLEERSGDGASGSPGDCVESTSSAIDWMKDRDRFFLFMSCYGGHDYEVEFSSQWARGKELEIIDSQIGRLLDHMTSSSAVDKTAIVVFSDHGCVADEDGERARSGFLDDTTLRIPLMMRLPGLTDGLVVEEQVRAIDIFPTLLEYFGLLPFLPEGAICDGRSLVPLISGIGTEEIPPAFSESYVGLGRTGGETTPERCFSARTESVKLLYEKTSRKWRGYDLEKGPGETRDISVDDEPRFSELKRRLQEYIRRGEELEEVRMISEKEGPVRRSLEALGYVEGSMPQSTSNIAFFSALSEGKRLMNRGKHQEAVEKLSEVLSMEVVKEDLRLDAQMCLAEALHRLKRNDEAIDKLEQILNRSADSRLSARAAFLMATIEVEEHSIEKGISVIESFLETAHSVAPDDEIMLRAKRAALCRETQQYERAIVDYELILEISPQNIDTCYNLGSLFKQISNYARAQACFQQVLRISTPHPDKYHGGAHYHLADISLKRSLHAHAEESLRHCLRINPKHGAARRELDRVSSSSR